MAKDEYRVNMKDERGRKSFTLVNATSEREAKRTAEKHHGAKTITGANKTGRSF